MVQNPDKIIPLRNYGRWISGAIVLICFALLLRAFAHGQIEWPVVVKYFSGKMFLVGLWHTLLVSVTAMILGLILGFLFAVMRISKNPVTSTVARSYIWFFRGTPVYLQLLLWFNLALIFPTVNLGFYHGEMVDVMTPFLAAFLGLGVNEGSYMAEIVRGGILSIDQGQMEAALSLGMTKLQAMRRIILPQTMRVIAPPTGNEFIGLLKASSMASAIAYTELLRQAQVIYYVNDKIMELLIVAAGWYLIVVTIFSTFQARIERYFAKGQAHEEAPNFIDRFWRNLIPRCFISSRG